MKWNPFKFYEYSDEQTRAIIADAMGQVRNVCGIDLAKFPIEFHPWDVEDYTRQRETAGSWQNKVYLSTQHYNTPKEWTAEILRQVLFAWGPGMPGLTWTPNRDSVRNHDPRHRGLSAMDACLLITLYGRPKTRPTMPEPLVEVGEDIHEQKLKRERCRKEIEVIKDLMEKCQAKIEATDSNEYKDKLRAKFNNYARQSEQQYAGFAVAERKLKLYTERKRRLIERWTPLVNGRIPADMQKYVRLELSYRPAEATGVTKRSDLSFIRAIENTKPVTEFEYVNA